MKAIGSFLSDVWRLTRPYFVSEEKWSAWILLTSIIVLNLSLVGMSVVLNFWNRLFFNSLQQKNYQAFLDLLFTWRPTAGGWVMPGFCEIVAVYIVVSIYGTYLSQWLQIRWRRWLTRKFLDEWLADRAYYRISLAGDTGAIGTDNPDQRIAEDLNGFVGSALSLGVDFLSNIVSFGSFVGILWGLSGEITIRGFTIPGYMVWVALTYAVLGTWLTHLVGRPLIALRFLQQKVEANFRYALVRLRENVEGIALYRGEAEEMGHLRDRFHSVITNWWSIMIRLKRLNALVAGYSQLAIIFPYVVAAPRYFTGKIELGGLTQTAGAFGQVQSSLSWFVNAYALLAQWRAVVDRLTGFHRAIVLARAASAKGLTVASAADTHGPVRLDDLTLALPDGTRILDHAALAFRPGESVVVTGRSGSGKSTLFRALAGIWPFARGEVRRPGTSLFLPQRPYIPLGTLRAVVTYPAQPDSIDPADIARALTDTGLAGLIAHLDDEENWPQRLSGGEQQRVALARALLIRPDWLFLDEATASLDPQAEEELYRVLKARLPATTLVSIAHRPAVADFHDRRLVLYRAEGQPGRIEEMEPAPASAAE